MSQLQDLKAQVKWIVGQLHSCRPDLEVADEIKSRLDKAGIDNKKTRRALVEYAIKCHKRNRELFVAVSTGRL